MTRFARAKGSKASNERVPEEATSWQEMKRQMEEKKLEEKAKKEKSNLENKATYKQSSDVDTTIKWAIFQDGPSKEIKSEDKGSSKIFKSNKTKKKKIVVNERDSTGKQVIKINEVISKNKEGYDCDDAPEETSAKITPIVFANQPKKRKKERITISTADQVINTSKIISNNKEEADDSDDAPEEASAKIAPTVFANKPIKRKKERVVIDFNAGLNKTDEIEKQKLEATDSLKTGRKKKRFQKLENEGKAERVQQGNAESNKLKKSGDTRKYNVNQQHNRDSKRRLPKVRDDKEHKRRKPLLEDTTIILNGKRVELMYFGGFLIKKEEANRLFKLRNEMRKKGVPQSEINITLKLERRKAEKALAREKKKLCFHCRQSGHELSECPDINDGPNTQSIGTGICFKCGSTEHTHFECKVVRNENYKFATCFICKEEGHISKQCPDNPRGIYPRGGACRVCQDVTHLKKDCPVFQQQQESANATLNTIGSENIEGIEREDTQVDTRKKIKPKKIIKFKD